eukprot:360045-Chlamydomonas_euryale.AAC.2
MPQLGEGRQEYRGWGARLARPQARCGGHDTSRRQWGSPTYWGAAQANRHGVTQHTQSRGLSLTQRYSIPQSQPCRNLSQPCDGQLCTSAALLPPDAPPRQNLFQAQDRSHCSPSSAPPLSTHRRVVRHKVGAIAGVACERQPHRACRFVGRRRQQPPRVARKGDAQHRSAVHGRAAWQAASRKVCYGRASIKREGRRVCDRTFNVNRSFAPRVGALGLWLSGGGGVHGWQASWQPPGQWPAGSCFHGIGAEKLGLPALPYGPRACFQGSAIRRYRWSTMRMRRTFGGGARPICVTGLLGSPGGGLRAPPGVPVLAERARPTPPPRGGAPPVLLARDMPPPPPPLAPRPSEVRLPPGDTQLPPGDTRLPLGDARAGAFDGLLAELDGVPLEGCMQRAVRDIRLSRKSAGCNGLQTDEANEAHQAREAPEARQAPEAPEARAGGGHDAASRPDAVRLICAKASRQAAEGGRHEGR